MTLLGKWLFSVTHSSKRTTFQSGYGGFASMRVRPCRLNDFAPTFTRFWGKTRKGSRRRTCNEAKPPATFQFRYRSLSLHLNSPTLLVNSLTRPVNSVPLVSFNFSVNWPFPPIIIAWFVALVAKLKAFHLKRVRKLEWRKIYLFNICFMGKISSLSQLAAREVANCDVG